MAPALYALIVAAVVAASGLLLWHVLVTEARAHEASDRRRPELPQLPEVPPPVLPAPPPRPPVLPPPVPVAVPPAGWRWTPAGWVPATWALAAPPPPRPSAARGCASAAGVGCVLLLGMAVVAALGTLVGLSGLFLAIARALAGA